MKKDQSPSERLTEFLNYLDRLSAEYKCAADIVKQEDKKTLDFVHAVEFAADKAERNRVATQLHNSRKLRRANKDIVMRDELIVNFFEEPENRKVLNKLRQLLGRQRKQEENGQLRFA